MRICKVSKQKKLEMPQPLVLAIYRTDGVTWRGGDWWSYKTWARGEPINSTDKVEEMENLNKNVVVGF